MPRRDDCPRGQTARQSQQQQVDYWQAIIAGHMPSGMNPFAAMYGLPDFATGQFNPLGQQDLAQNLLQSFQGSGITLAQILTVLQQIQANTTLVSVP